MIMYRYREIEQRIMNRNIRNKSTVITDPPMLEKAALALQTPVAFLYVTCYKENIFKESE